MEILFIIICAVMTGLLVWGLEWYYLLASGFATLCMLAIFKVSGPG